MHFREWKVLYYDQIFTEVCSHESNKQQSSVGLNNGLAPNRRLAIIWTNAGPIQWSICVALGGGGGGWGGGVKWSYAYHGAIIA